MKQYNANEVEEKIRNISKSRGKRRERAIRIATTNLYAYLKTLNYSEVTRGFLKTFFGKEITPRTRKRVLRAIINELKKEGKIREEFVFKTITFFENCPLFSQDYGSYSLMMKKNKGKARKFQGVYSMSSLSVKKRVKFFKMKVYVIL